MTQIQGYVLDDEQRTARDPVGPPMTPFPRCDALARLFDPTTVRHMEVLGVGHGWRCWEVAAGGAAVANWLVKKVGPTGRVVATDTDISWAGARARQVEVRRHDLGSDEAPGDGFDLVHARLALA